MDKKLEEINHPEEERSKSKIFFDLDIDKNLTRIIGFIILLNLYNFIKFLRKFYCNN